MPKTVKRDFSGQKINRLSVLYFVPDDTKHSKFMCKCDCGNNVIVYGQTLLTKSAVSCGCYAKEQTAKRLTTHGMAGKNRTRTYNSWASMMTRCVWGHHESYKTYGEMGITVCERWHNFENFLSDMGERPIGRSIDRLDTSGNYEPSNCRWATRREQALNKKKTVKLIYNGELITNFELATKLKISLKALEARIRRRGGDYIAGYKSYGIEVSLPVGRE
ncbi:hypothetical protein [Methylobacillus sp.]|uniref:hypothetical protein n=1 Tax=Methylobacillus sp. TaxID=56818 RepID=UPI002FE0DDD3